MIISLSKARRVHGTWLLADVIGNSIAIPVIPLECWILNNVRINYIICENSLDKLSGVLFLILVLKKWKLTPKYV